MSIHEREVREIVRRILEQALKEPAKAPPAAPAETPTPPPATARVGKRLITEADVQEVPPGGTLEVPADAIVTPLARQAAMERRVALVVGGKAQAPKPVAGPQVRAASGERVVALGADHGGFELKEVLKAFLTEQGYTVLDCGTDSPASVDYPDFAYAVAKLVSEGRAWRGIMVDGAGIGSCMAANKVPGVRAAMCYDVSTAVNSREHNDANVLTLGGRLIGTELAKEIVRTWLTTEFGGGRHARRVEKIMEIERRFLRR